ncbi:M20/M25/M40 family metallo-hydrolase [Alkalihalobacterium chitinilyticum]|uniref:M20/M25/M40 family metallo-hydrolase n=1 Tax=Alkalihalobacterium chitinilyticum TaxID=2980103 RepID=A0ABT5VFT1_9BACI|nr:M20/M25/M40 family metallo-hydrolase [Alkalihalobacterium chitinilyticum]MDE5414307.1 M20/M25/M40 family metallo-hydrolase [Alkalihalobacterium chitinilyticum]
MKTWNQLFTRHGWLLEEQGGNTFDCINETELNLQFLFECLEKANVEFIFNKGMLSLLEESIGEEDWIEAIQFPQRGRGEGLWFHSGHEAPKVRELDVYISGVVRQFNRIGFYTTGSCDGHGRRAAHVMLTKDCNIETLNEMLLALGIRRVYWREHRNSFHLPLALSQNELLNLAEKMSVVDENWLGHGVDFIKEQLFYQQLEQLLMIPGVSGNEGRVREFVMKKLSPFVDHMTVDHTGNVLAEKTYRSGHGPTILLNAHLDTAYELEEDRVISKKATIWSSSKGILGADDRAGIAVILHLIEHLYHSTFSGRVKVIFTVEEECGLIGAKKVDEYFLWGTDAAIVVDRRGNGDIVTSCGSFQPFCDPEYGDFFEKVAVEEGLSGWATTIGGSSDTRIWAGHSIQSVNLSAGYMNEHTDEENLDVAACYQTAKLLIGVFKREKELRRVLRKISRQQQVAKICREAQ